MVVNVMTQLDSRVYRDRRRVYPQKRFRKFDLYVSSYSRLYRKTALLEKCWDLYHNPIPDFDTSFTSFANPNYRLDDLLNSNVSTENTYNEIASPDTTPVAGTQDRRFHMDLLSPGSESSDFSTYQSPMSPGSDGDSDLHISDLDTYESIDHYKAPKTCKGPTTKSNKSTGFLGYYAMLENKAREVKNSISSGSFVDEVDCGSISLSNSNSKESNISTPDSNDSGIQSDVRSDDGAPPHVVGPLDDIYAVVKKPNKKDALSHDENEKLLDDKSSQGEATTPTNDGSLPSGWQKYYDEEGAYFWHLKSGTIQRDMPTTNDPFPERPDPQIIPTVPLEPVVVSAKPTEKSTSDLPQPQPIEEPKEEVAKPTEETVRYAVRSLGWVGIAEEDLTPERSSKAVNKCIVDLSLGRNDINDVVGRWGDGNDLYLDLDSDSLRLVHPTDDIILNSQPIHSVRVWGVGRDNGRDFAYVARDKVTRKHMCHVFRCDVPARQIANTLRDICKKIMLERSMAQSIAVHKTARPTNLPNLSTDLSLKNFTNLTSFPTPMEEPRKVIHCHYIGCERVNKPTGMDVVNSAIERAYTKIPPERWVFADVAIAPSTISIHEHGNMSNKIDECRVRFLSFLGIAMKNAKLCAFILHLAGDQYFAHVFHCEPSAGPLCKTIEAACKLRYQKCLDSHPQVSQQSHSDHSTVKTIGESVKAGVQTHVTKAMRGMSTIRDFVRGTSKESTPPTHV